MSRIWAMSVLFVAGSAAAAAGQEGVIRPTPPPLNAPTGALVSSTPLTGSVSAPTAPHLVAPEPTAVPPRRILFRRAAPGWQFAPRWSQPMAIRTEESGAHPKYRGGFHSSYYYNLGLPSGDIGFRGNGIYWTPW